MVAIKEAVELAEPDAPLRIISDSKTCIDGLTKNLKKWEDRGFLTVANGEIARLTVTTLRQRRAKTTLEWAKAHSGIPGNEAADALAAEGSARQNIDVVNTCVDAAMILPGAKLQAMTQSIAYKIIREIKMAQAKYEHALGRRATTRNMELAQGAATGEDDEPPSKAKIWMSTRHKDISRSIRFFLWMLIHDGYKVGHHWTHIPGHEEKQECSHCGAGVIESMEHILTRCEAPGQEIIWDLASELWRKKTDEDLRPTVGQIMACGAIDKGTPGKTRLYRILVSESAHLVWRLRNERVIQEKGPASAREVHNRWLKAVNNRLQIDCAMTNKKKYFKKAMRASVVKETWGKVLKNEDRLPKEWFRETGVLVGVG
ncbi:hypothetical protein C8R43DRAFT_1063516 [Mycena crocata]|nr:hypothetical protein C8R43DRAFT_1063516 [Mycena crocata]